MGATSIGVRRDVTVAEEEPAGWWVLSRGVFWGEVWGTLLLVPAFLLLTGLHVIGEGNNDTLLIYLPWLPIGWWAVVASGAYGFLISLTIGWTVRSALARRGVTVAYAWCFAAVAGGGYTAVLIGGHRWMSQTLIAVLLTSALVSLLGFDRRRMPRQPPTALAIGRRTAGLCCLAALAVSLSYGLLHPFVGSSPDWLTSTPDAAPGDIVVHQGQTVSFIAQLSPARMRVNVAAVGLVGHTQGLRLLRVNVAASGDVSAKPDLPNAIPANSDAEVYATFRVDRCSLQTLSIHGVRLAYTALGVPLEQTVALRNARDLICS